MPLTASGLKEIRQNIRNISKSAIFEQAKRAIGKPVNLLEPPFKFPPTQSESPIAERVLKKFADLFEDLF